MNRKKSPLVTVERLSPNYTKPRNKKIRRLTPHCVAGNLSVESTLGLSNFQTANSKSGSSTNYAIGSDGRIGLGVEEMYRAWTTSSPANDHESITSEISNNGGAPDWRMSDAAINAWLDLAVDSAQFHGFKKINYQAKPANITIAQVETWIKTWAKDGEMIITLHNWYANKACPGPYFTRQLPWLVKEINKRLQDPKWEPEAFVGEGSTPPVVKEPQIVQPPTTLPVNNQPPQQNKFEPYLIRITASALNIRKGPGTNNPIVKTLINDKNVYTIVEEKTGPGAKMWGRLKSGDGFWISLDHTVRK